MSFARMIFLGVIAASQATVVMAGDRYFYCDGSRAYYCKPPAQFTEGCYIVRDGTSVIKVGSFPVISSDQATMMMQDYAAPLSHPVDPVDSCCGTAHKGDCKCKHGLNCELTLSRHPCNRGGQLRKTPRRYNIVGKIPKIDDVTDCYKEITKFNYNTLVPTIVCTTHKCVEIGTKTIQCEVGDCKPGCSFRVCVPINDCTTKTVECRLVDKEMPHRVMQRTDPDSGEVTFDVYVINNSDESSPYHAGGMPEEWLVMHCASKDDVRRKFPSMVVSNRGKNVEPQLTDADVNIKLAFDKDAIAAYLEQHDKDSEDSGDKSEKGESDLAESESVSANKATS